MKHQLHVQDYEAENGEFYYMSYGNQNKDHFVEAVQRFHGGLIPSPDDVWFGREVWTSRGKRNWLPYTAIWEKDVKEETTR